MSPKNRHNVLSADDRSDIRSTILQARKTLEDEFERQLERYGIYDDEQVPVSSLPHLSIEDIATRKEIDAALERELEATDGLYGRAYQNYVRETTKEYLNRLVGLKTIEARDLVTETLRTQAEYGNRSYMHYTVDEIAGELTDTSDDGLGVALDLAYQEIGSEIQVLFDGSDYTALEPDFTVRREILEELDDLGDDVWPSDEAMGWVYQYFGENEREKIDDRIDEENYKVQDTDIATKTQLFTPRYIVEWMVDNSLGRLWLEMHGDRTNIDDENKCFYLTPLEESLIDRDVKDVREIKVLDPACGSGHMLFYAFDVLYEMYLEHSDVAEKHIPREILKNNLYGIDIDEGATQIAALALYVKAKSHAPEVAIEGMNIVSANAVLVNGEKKQEVLERADSELERRVLEQVWTSFEHIREWGSLVRIEEQIEDIIEEELEEVKATGQTQFTSDGLAKQSSVVSYSGEEESWEQVKNRLLEQVTELAEQALEENDPIGEIFTDEVEKSIHLLEILSKEYDVVISNPPYLSSNKMGGDLKEFVKSNYIGSKNLYSAFIERCLEFVPEDGHVSMVTPDSFMFLYSHKKLRSHILHNSKIIDGVHLARYGFDNQKDRYVIPFTLRLTESDDGHVSRFYRMTQEQERYSDFNKKVSGLKQITNANRRGKNHQDIYMVDQSAFEKIGRQPFLYWFGQEILNLFIENENIGDIGDVKVGLQTSDDDRFVRRWWEIKEDQIGEKYYWYELGGDDFTYYNSSESTILWEDGGKEVMNYEKSYPRNSEYYGNRGINFRKFSKVFTARLQPEGHIFSDATRFVYTEEVEDEALLGYLCSSLSRFIMNGLNPSLNFQAGDAERLPIDVDGLSNSKLVSKVNQAIEYRKSQFEMQETKREFKGSEIIDNFEELLYFLDRLEASIEIVHGEIDTIIYDIYNISQNTIDIVHEDLPADLSKLPHVENIGSLPQKFESVSTKEFSDQEYQTLLNDIEDLKSDDIREIAEEVGVSPISVAMIREKHHLYTKDEKREAAGRLLSYYLGVLFGRWDNLEKQITSTGDGILVFDERFDDNITNRIRECIEATFDDVYEKEAEIEDLLNKDMTNWLRENFFRYHHTKEYRRRGQRIPIYWHLESDNGAFSCFLYYHAMDAETLPKLRGQYVDAKIDTLENRLESTESQLEGATDDRKPELNSELEEVQEQLDDVRDFGERLDELIDEGFEPDFEAGIWENIQQVDEYDLLQTELDKL